MATPDKQDITITLADDVQPAVQRMGHVTTIKRSVANEHLVNIHGVIRRDVVLPSKTLDAATFVHAYANNSTDTWYLINYTATTKH